MRARKHTYARKISHTRINAYKHLRTQIDADAQVWLI